MDKWAGSEAAGAEGREQGPGLSWEALGASWKTLGARHEGKAVLNPVTASFDTIFTRCGTAPMDAIAWAATSWAQRHAGRGPNFGTGNRVSRNGVVNAKISTPTRPTSYVGRSGGASKGPESKLEKPRGQPHLECLCTHPAHKSPSPQPQPPQPSALSPQPLQPLQTAVRTSGRPIHLMREC